jgi:hypothetical protein
MNLLRYPGGLWRPLGPQTQPLMRAHDIVCLHTMAGYLTGTRSWFAEGNGPGYKGTESHFGVGGKWGPDLAAGLDGVVDQWQDLRYTADANLEGADRVISIETADNAARPIEAWSAAQVEALVDLLVWLADPATHADCPSSWTCHLAGIPLTVIPDTLPGRRGIGWHAQGIAPQLVAGGEVWSRAAGKDCPTAARIAQIPGLVARAAAKAETIREDEIMPTADEIAEAVVVRLADVLDPTAPSKVTSGRLARNVRAQVARAIPEKTLQAAAKAGAGAALEAVMSRLRLVPAGDLEETEAVVELDGPEIDAIASAVADELASRLRPRVVSG